MSGIQPDKKAKSEADADRGTVPLNTSAVESSGGVEGQAEFSHLDERGRARMVDISDKPVTRRVAVASGRVRMSAETLERIRRQDVAKGDVLQVARLAGIMAAKRTSEWIPLCHPLPLTSVEVNILAEPPNELVVHARCQTDGKTGVEMEALVAVSACCLTIYDMSKSLDRGMEIGAIRLEEKEGGRSGHFHRKS